MRSVIVSTLIALASAHGVVLSVEGANGVSMPGLSVADGTPRDCSSNRCGSQADTSIIRDREIASGKASALGRTQGNGPVDPVVMISNFMGTSSQAPTNKGASGSVGVEDDVSGIKGATNRRALRERQVSSILDGFLGGNGGNNGNNGDKGNKNSFPVETLVTDTAGQGSTSGLPTASDDGEVTMIYRQINQDGAGPLTADIDGTSGGSDPKAFQRAEVTQDVPGLGFQGLSLATNTDFSLKVRMPAGMTCDGSVAGVDKVCIVRVRNGAAAGPFGGSGAFTQSAAARKRAIAYRLKKRLEISRQ